MKNIVITITPEQKTAALAGDTFARFLWLMSEISELDEVYDSPNKYAIYDETLDVLGCVIIMDIYLEKFVDMLVILNMTHIFSKLIFNPNLLMNYSDWQLKQSSRNRIPIKKGVFATLINDLKRQAILQPNIY